MDLTDATRSCSGAFLKFFRPPLWEYFIVRKIPYKTRQSFYQFAHLLFIAMNVFLLLKTTVILLLVYCSIIRLKGITVIKLIKSNEIIIQILVRRLIELFTKIQAAQEPAFRNYNSIRKNNHLIFNLPGEAQTRRKSDP